ncbi:heterokaryon incompatibility protein-domain-containing protein [Xylariaceae sp. FL0804]|nr:heterokaryon incompatibility protein-domain-containing protein [Xylariaceae sp. FL0804]
MRLLHWTAGDTLPNALQSTDQSAHPLPRVGESSVEGRESARPAQSKPQYEVEDPSWSWAPSCSTALRLVDFQAKEPPPYAILSHTWEEAAEGSCAEVTFQEFEARTVTEHNLRGWRKIQKACEEAQKRGLQHMWIDSCCINKADSSELAEAINSMYMWYSRAAVCLVYLSDWQGTSLGECRWFRRGWTLQELIASCHATFYNSEWTCIGDKDGANSETLAQITGIDHDLLLCTHAHDIRHRLSRMSVCQRMSWASRRTTTRIEDEAYCLLGIFDLHMPLLYGEREGAFLRLQQMIAQTTNDLTLFAWRQQEGVLATTHNPMTIINVGPLFDFPFHDPYHGLRLEECHGIFACSLREFASGGAITTSGSLICNPEFAVTNKGLRISSSVMPYAGWRLLPLNCCDSEMGTSSKHDGLAIALRWIEGNVYARADIGNLYTVPLDPEVAPDQKEMYLAVGLRGL